MMRRYCPIIGLFAVSAVSFAQDVNDGTEKAMKETAAKTARYIARIETSGGQEAVWAAGPKGPNVAFRRGTGATTGLVVDPEGYVLTSSFNFVGKPTDIFVTVPGKARTVAKVVGTDPTRMVTLLKIDQTGLAVPPIYPKKDIEVGQWSVALGRTLNPNIDSLPSINGGIISAVNRVWGKAVQSDAKISPINYGGPLCALDGRVMGIIVPISPNSEGETAGFEWYDVGIGFAVPLEDVMRVLPQLKAGTADKPAVLRSGLLGVTFREADHYAPGPTVDIVTPASPAERAGMKSGDRIIEADGKTVLNTAQLFHVLRPKYENDSINLKVDRGGKSESFEKIVLSGNQAAFDAGFLGILPMRDDPEPGVAIRYVFTGTAAEKAGLKPGDRIMKVGRRFPGGVVPKGAAPMLEFAGRDQFAAIMQSFTAATALNVEVRRKDGTMATLEVVLGSVQDDTPLELPKESSAGKALVAPKTVGSKKEPPKKVDPKKEEPKKEEPKKEEPKKDDPKKEPEKPKTGLQKVAGEGATGRNYWVFVPDTYDPNVSHGLIIWLHPAGRDGRDAEDLVRLWELHCEKHNFIMVGPTASAATGWVKGDDEGIMADVRAVRTRYTIDPKRVVVHGSGVGGQMAFHLGINQREVIRGVAPVGAVLASNPKQPIPNQRIQFFIVGGSKDPLIGDIRKSHQDVKDRKYPAVYREMKESGKEYIADDLDIFRELIRWIDTLDRL